MVDCGFLNIMGKNYPEEANKGELVNFTIQVKNTSEMHNRFQLEFTGDYNYSTDFFLLPDEETNISGEFIMPDHDAIINVNASHKEDIIAYDTFGTPSMTSSFDLYGNRLMAQIFRVAGDKNYLLKTIGLIMIRVGGSIAWPELWISIKEFNTTNGIIGPSLSYGYIDNISEEFGWNFARMSGFRLEYGKYYVIIYKNNLVAPIKSF